MITVNEVNISYWVETLREMVSHLEKAHKSNPKVVNFGVRLTDEKRDQWLSGSGGVDVYDGEEGQLCSVELFDKIIATSLETVFHETYLNRETVQQLREDHTHSSVVLYCGEENVITPQKNHHHTSAMMNFVLDDKWVISCSSHWYYSGAPMPDRMTCVHVRFWGIE